MRSFIISVPATLETYLTFNIANNSLHAEIAFRITSKLYIHHELYINIIALRVSGLTWEYRNEAGLTCD